MEIKDLKLLARKILDVHGFENTAIRFSHSLAAGAWIYHSRKDTPPMWTYENGKRKAYIDPQLAEYPSLTFSLEFARKIDLDIALRFIFHELSHLMRGPSWAATKTSSYKVSQFANEMDIWHDYKWIQQMWKFGYPGKPRFNSKEDKIQHELLKENGFVCTGSNPDGRTNWDPPKTGPWKDGAFSYNKSEANKCKQE